LTIFVIFIPAMIETQFFGMFKL